MVKNNKRVARVASVALSAWVALTPVFALAEEEERSGIQLLVPALAELIPATIAFCIIFTLLSKFAWPMIVKMMTEREEKIQGDISAAEEAKEQAQANAQTYVERLAAAEREAAEIVAAAKREAEEERARILAKAQKDAAATVSKARDIMEAERRKAMVQLSGSVVDLSVEIAGKIIGNDLNDDQHRALAEKYLAEVGNVHDAQS